MQLSRNLMLRRLGITVWKIRYPIILIKNQPIHLLIKLKLLIISDVLISLHDIFIQDVIRSMYLNQTQICIITIDQIKTVILPKNFLSYCWWVGVAELCNYHCVTFNTPSLLTLKSNVNAKRDFWHQINVSFRP